MTKIAFPTDEHYPYQDEKARSVALQIVRDFDPDELPVGSDGLDFYSLSSFDMNPERMKLGLQKEIDAWKAGQAEWRDAAPNASRKFIPGNHEDRLRRWLWKNSEVADLNNMQLPELLGFINLGIIWNKKEYMTAELEFHNRLIVRHGKYIRQHSGMSAKSELEAEKHSISVITGHTHRGGSYFARTRNGIVQAHEGFCLCRLDPEYVSRPNWQQGITLATVTSEYLSVEPIAFFDYKNKKKAAIWRDKLYTS